MSRLWLLLSLTGGKRDLEEEKSVGTTILALARML